MAISTTYFRARQINEACKIWTPNYTTFTAF